MRRQRQSRKYIQKTERAAFCMAVAFVGKCILSSVTAIHDTLHAFYRVHLLQLVVQRRAKSLGEEERNAESATAAISRPPVT